MTVAAALAGGSVFGACETRFRTALVDGTKNYFFTLLDPELFLEFINDPLDQTTSP